MEVSSDTMSSSKEKGRESVSVPRTASRSRISLPSGVSMPRGLLSCVYCPISHDSGSRHTYFLSHDLAERLLESASKTYAPFDFVTAES